jgi:uncharacterized protein VirK/YbjX
MAIKREADENQAVNTRGKECWSPVSGPPTPESYEAKGLRTLRLRALAAPLTALRWRRYLSALHARVGAGAPKARALSKPLRSYLRRHYWPWRRAAILMETWDWLEGSFSAPFLKRLCDNEDALILSIHARKNSQYGLYVTAAVNAAMQREGEIALYCARSPQDEKLCRASFSITKVDGRPALVIGGIQGPFGALKREVIDATREMYGLRPKDAVLLAIRAFALEMGLATHAVSDSRHVLHRLTNKTKFSSYDDYWRERGAHEGGPFGYVFEGLEASELEASKRDALKGQICRATVEFLRAAAREGAYARALSAAATSSSALGSSMVAGIAQGS